MLPGDWQRCHAVMAVVDMREEPVVKLIDLFPEFFGYRSGASFGLEWKELHFEVVRQAVIIVVHSLFSLTSTRGRCRCSSFEVRVCSLL